MISDLDLIDLLSEASGPEICFVDEKGSTLYRLINKGGNITRVDQREGNGDWETVWTRPAPEPTEDQYLRAAKMMFSSTYGLHRNGGSH
jgi:hypothetical protein